MTTPKQLARSLVKYGKRHPELRLTAFFLPQIPGGRTRSHRIDGVYEAFGRSKKYILSLAVFHPWVAAGIAAMYLSGGQFNLAHYAEMHYALGDVLSAGNGTGSQ